MIEALVAVLAAIVAYLLGLRRSRRERIEALYTNAFAAVAALHASRYLPSHIDPARVPSIPVERLEQVRIEMGVDALKRFAIAAETARASLGAIYPYCAEVRPYWEKFEITEDEIDDVLDVLSRGVKNLGLIGRARRLIRK